MLDLFRNLEDRFSHDTAQMSHVKRKLAASDHLLPGKYEPRSEKTGLRGFRPGLIQTRLYSHRR